MHDLVTNRPNSLPKAQWKNRKHTLCANLCCCRLRPAGRNLERGARAEDAVERTEALEDARVRCILKYYQKKSEKRLAFKAKELGAPREIEETEKIRN